MQSIAGGRLRAGYGDSSAVYRFAQCRNRGRLRNHGWAVVGALARLGVGAIVNSGAVVDHDAQVMDFGHLGVGACMAGGTVLGRGAWMQAGAALGYGVRVPDGAVLPPGASLLG